MPEPKISAIVPCYNYGQFISESIDSILAQTYSNYEIIIIDDGSDDGTTPAVIASEAQKDERIKVITHPKNKGVSAARNSGIKAARGKYILPLDADDRIAPTYLEKTVALIIKENADLICTHYKCFGEKTHINYILPNGAEIKKRLPFANALPVCSLYKKSAWQEFRGYDEKLPGYEDWDFWLHFAEADKKLVPLDEALFYYRVSSDGSYFKDLKKHHSLVKIIKKNHPNLYRWHNYYLTFYYLYYMARRSMFQIRTRKGRRIICLFGIVLYKEE